MESIFLQVGLLFITLGVCPAAFKFLRFPYVVSYIVAGFLGKIVFTDNIVEPVLFLKEIAISLLFFFIGLEYSFEKLKDMWRIVIPGFLDLLFNFAIPFIILTLLLGVSYHQALIFSAVLYPSSTAITTKLLIDYKRLASPEADFLIGLLIFEDLVCIFLLSLYTPIFAAKAQMSVAFAFVLIVVIFAKLTSQQDCRKG